MDKETLSHYGWIVVILILGLFVILMATPLGNYIYSNLKFGTVNQIKNIRGEDVYDNSANTEIERLAITYNLDGGVFDGAHITSYVNGIETILPTNVKKDNYEFIGWHRVGDSNANSITSTIPKDMTYDANYTAIYTGKLYRIAYNLNGGEYSGYLPRTYRYGQTTSIPSNYTPTRTGYVFGGWYSNPALTIPAENITATTTGDKMFYAKWKLMSQDEFTEEFETAHAGETVPQGYTFTYGDYEYTIVDNDVSVRVKTGSRNKTELGPMLHTAYGVRVKTLYECFRNMTSLIIPPEISKYTENLVRAFEGCSNLLVAPEIPTTIEYMTGAFKDCISLVEIPNLQNCSELTTMWSTFENCAKLFTYTGSSDGTFSGFVIPGNVDRIEDAFKGCSSITVSPDVPSSAINCKGAFSGCSSLTRAGTINQSSGERDCSNMFKNCVGLSVAPNVPTNVTKTESMFEGCTGLKMPPLTIPNTVTTMKRMFYNCTALLSAPTISNQIENMSEAFYGCRSLKTYTGSPENDGYFTNYVITTSRGNLLMKNTFQGCVSMISTPTISVTHNTFVNLDYTYSGCTALSHVSDIPFNILNKNYTFQNCINLSGIIYVENLSNWDNAIPGNDSWKSGAGNVSVAQR